MADNGVSSTPILPSTAGVESAPIGGPTTSVPLAGSAQSDTYFVKSPVTGDIRAVPQAEAAELVLRAGWEPVVEPAAERLLSNQLLRERSSPYTAAGLGAFSGLTGGLGNFVLPGEDQPGGRAFHAAQEEHPVAGFTGELAGTAAPFLGPLRGVKLLSLPGLAEGAGAAVTAGSEGALGKFGARALGMGLEGGIQGASYEAGQTAIDDSPLTAQKLAAGFLLGATPGAILGGAIGGAEGLFARYGVRGKIVRDNILRPGMDDLDMMQIAQREHGVAVPGLSDEILSGIANDQHVTPEVAAMARDAGPVGQQVRKEMLEAPELRRAAYVRAAHALNEIRDMDEAAIGGVAGKMKGEQVRKWIPAGEENDPGMAIMEAWREDTPDELGVRQRQMDETNAIGPRGAPAEQPPIQEDAKRQEFTNFLNQHPQKQQLQEFINEERRAVSEYEREGTAGLGVIGIDGTRAGNVRNLASTEHGAQRVLNDAVENGFADRGVFYRGERVSRDFFEHEIQPLMGHKGRHLENPNIWSTADSPEGAISFAKRKLGADQVPVLYEIHTNAAVPADRVPGSNTFEEHLLPRGRKLWVMDVQEKDGVMHVRLMDSDKPPVYSGIKPRGPISTVEKQPGRIVESAAPPAARSERIGKLGKALEVWAHDYPEVDGELRRSLGAGYGRKNLRDAIRRGLIGRDPELMSSVQRAYGSASSESRAAIDELLGKHFDIKSTPGIQPWRQDALELLDDLGKHVDAIGSQSKGVIGKKPADAFKIRDIIADAYRKVKKGDKAEAFIELDYIKKRLAKYAAPGEYLSVDQNVAALARNQYEDVRQMLERPELWGQKAAIAQKDINRIFNRRINRGDVFFDKFYVDSGKAHPANPWIRQKEATPESVEKQLNGIIDPKNSREFQAFKQHIQESKDVLANLRQHYALSGNEENALGRWGNAVSSADHAFDLAAYYSRREAQASALMKSHQGPIPSWGKWVAMHFLGPAGFLGVGAAEKVLNPGKGMYMRAVLERTMRTSESRIAGAITKLITGKSQRIAGLGLSQMAARESVSLFGDNHDDRQKAYISTIQSLSQMADPNQASQQIRQALPFAVHSLPGVEMNLGSTMSKAAQYILSKAPNQPRWTPYGIKTDPVSDSELESFEATVQGAMDPVSVFEQAADGKPVSPDAVEAMETVQPEMVDHLRMLAMSELTQSGKEISYSNTINVSMVLGIDLDPSLNSEYINAQQMTYAGRKASQPTPSDDRTTGNESGINKQYRQLNMTKDQQIELGEPPT